MCNSVYCLKPPAIIRKLVLGSTTAVVLQKNKIGVSVVSDLLLKTQNAKFVRPPSQLGAKSSLQVSPWQAARVFPSK